MLILYERLSMAPLIGFLVILRTTYVDPVQSFFKRHFFDRHLLLFRLLLLV